MIIKSSGYLDDLVSRCLSVSGIGVADVALTFQQQLETVYEKPVVAAELLEDVMEAKVNAQHLRWIWNENLSLKGNLNKLTTLLRASTDCMYVVFLLRMHSLCTSLAFLFICWEEDPTPFHRGVIDGTF